eukprot:IDg13401t1
MGVHIADMRSSVESVSKLFGAVNFEFVALGPDSHFSPTVRETQEEIVKRGRSFFWQLRNRPERVIAVFTHSSFLLNTFSSGIVGIEEEESACRPLPRDDVRRARVLLTDRHILRTHRETSLEERRAPLLQAHIRRLVQESRRRPAGGVCTHGADAGLCRPRALGRIVVTICSSSATAVSFSSYGITLLGGRSIKAVSV